MFDFAGFVFFSLFFLFWSIKVNQQITTLTTHITTEFENDCCLFSAYVYFYWYKVLGKINKQKGLCSIQTKLTVNHSLYK